MDAHAAAKSVQLVMCVFRHETGVEWIRGDEMSMERHRLDVFQIDDVDKLDSVVRDDQNMLQFGNLVGFLVPMTQLTLSSYHWRAITGPPDW